MAPPKKQKKTLHIYFEKGSIFIFAIIPPLLFLKFQFRPCNWIKTIESRSLASFLSRESSNNTKGSTIILIVFTQQYLSQKSFKFQRNKSVYYFAYQWNQELRIILWKWMPKGFFQSSIMSIFLTYRSRTLYLTIRNFLELGTKA